MLGSLANCQDKTDRIEYNIIARLLLTVLPSVLNSTEPGKSKPENARVLLAKFSKRAPPKIAPAESPKSHAFHSAEFATGCEAGSLPAHLAARLCSDSPAMEAAAEECMAAHTPQARAGGTRSTALLERVVQRLWPPFSKFRVTDFCNSRPLVQALGEN